MKRIFINRVLAFLLIGATLTYAGCKDYDDDIGNVQTELSETAAALQEQLGALQTALTGAQNEAAAATQKAAAAKEAADEAAETAAAAQKAVADAKTEAIREAISQCQSLISDKADQSALDELASQIEGIEKNLSQMLKDYVTIDDMQKFEKALEVQQKALEKYADELGDKASSADLTALDQKLSGLIENIRKSAIDQATLEKAVKDLNAEIMEKVGEQLSSLSGVLSSRLTSVTLVPGLYVDGIPTIEFLSVSYNALTINPDGSTKKAAKATIVSDESTTADYRLNPTGVQKEDIGTPSFVSTTAVTRAAETGENTPVKVVGHDIENGILTVNAAKTSTEPLKLDGNKIYTVALKVPVADDCLFENETEAYVYSEYVRLAESTVTPVIAAQFDNSQQITDFDCAHGAHHHFSDYATIYGAAQAEKISKSIKYNEPFDLAGMVTGCYDDGANANEMTADKLEGYGLKFRFELAPDAYKLGPNQTDQQQFARIDGTTITSQVPGGEVNNRAAIDKEPIVRVTLVDTTNENQIVDVAYFKIKWVENSVSPDPIELGEIKTYVQNLSCSAIENDFLWKDMTQYVYAKVKEGGMSKDEFEAIYELKVNGKGTFGEGDGVITEQTSDVSEDAVALKWTLDAEAIGKIVPATSKEYSILITYTDPKGVAGDVTFSLKCTVNVTLPSISGYYDHYWLTPGKLVNIYPVQYNPDTNVMPAGTTCVYNYDLMQLFTPGADIVKGVLTPCGKWDLQFALTQPVTGYAPNLSVEPAGAADDAGYSLLKGGETAAELTFADGVDNWYAPRHPDANAVSFSIEKNDAGKNLIDSDTPKQVTLKVWADLNGYNKMQVAEFNANIIAPLTINAELENASFRDHVIGGSEIDCSNAFTMTDFNGYIVAESDIVDAEEKEKYAAALWKYYEVESVVWDTDNAKIGMKREGGSIKPDDQLTAEQSMPLADVYAGASITAKDSKLVFTNNSAGAGVEEACNVFIPATVKYGYGETTKWVKVRLEPGK